MNVHTTYISYSITIAASITSYNKYGCDRICEKSILNASIAIHTLKNIIGKINDCVTKCYSPGL